MATGVDIFGGIASIQQSIKIVSRCIHGLRCVSRKGGPLAEEVKLFTLEVDMLKSTMTNTDRLIKDQFLKYRDSRVLKELQEISALESLADRGNFVIKMVNNLQGRMHRQVEQSNWWMRLRWLLDKVKRAKISMLVHRVQLSY